MANVNKSNGTRWESLVAGYLSEYGLEAERTGSANADQGDIHAGEWTIEAKAEAKIDLPGYLRQLAAATERRRPVGYHYKSAVLVKNRRHSVQDGYAVMRLDNFRSLMLYVNAMEGTLREVLEQIEGNSDVRA
jgi:hypothetical protein